MVKAFCRKDNERTADGEMTAKVTATNRSRLLMCEFSVGKSFKNVEPSKSKFGCGLITILITCIDVSFYKIFK